jgi:hypothetical protein
MKTKIYFTIIIISLFLTYSCDKGYEEMNHNPHGFTSASDASLFNNIVSSLRLGWNEQFYINNEILYKQTQLAALTKEAWGNYTIGTEDVWSNYYLKLTLFRDLETKFETMGDTSKAVNNMKAMLKIVFAYKTFKVTDLFGAMPFFDAGWGFEDLSYVRPKYDSQEDIYKFLLDELQWAAENIDLTATYEPFATFSSFDNLLFGDLEKWQKFANSLRLRYAMRMYNKEPELAGEILKEIIENNLPVLIGYNFVGPVLESVAIWPYSVGWRNTGVVWSFREHTGLRMGTNIWNQMSENDSSDGSGIFDLRAYLFFETDNEDKWKAYPQIPNLNTPPSGGIPYGSQRNTNFNIKGDDCIYSPFNFYLIGDEDFVPEILMTGAEVHFIKAEAILRGIVQSEYPASTEYMNGVMASFMFWKEVLENSKLPTSGASFSDNITLPDLSESTLVYHVALENVTTEDEKLKLIYSQRSIDNFRQVWEAFSVTRRTMNTQREGADLDFFRLPYPPSEQEFNTVNWTEQAGKMGGDNTNVKVWWMQ